MHYVFCAWWIVLTAANALVWRYIPCDWSQPYR
jgi:hypothetical protein